MLFAGSDEGHAPAVPWSCAVTSQIERVADVEVRHRRPGFELSILSADQKKIDLTQPDKVVYQEGCASGLIAARKHITRKARSGPPALRPAKSLPHRPPLPEQEHQGEAPLTRNSVPNGANQADAEN